MSAKVDRAALAEALASAVRVVGTRSIIPHLRIEATDDLHIVATDGEHWIGLTVPCEGEFDPCLVNAQKLNDLVQALVGDTVEVSRSGGGLNLICGRGRRSLGTLPVDEWPERNIEWPVPVAIDAAKLRRFSRAVRSWIGRNPWCAGMTFRADAVFMGARGWPAHVADAFTIEGL